MHDGSAGAAIESLGNRVYRGRRVLRIQTIWECQYANHQGVQNDPLHSRCCRCLPRRCLPERSCLRGSMHLSAVLTRAEGSHPGDCSTSRAEQGGREGRHKCEQSFIFGQPERLHVSTLHHAHFATSVDASVEFSGVHRRGQRRRRRTKTSPRRRAMAARFARRRPCALAGGARRSSLVGQVHSGCDRSRRPKGAP